VTLETQAALACVAVVLGWSATFAIGAKIPGMFSKDKIVIGLAVVLGAVVPDLPALVALLDLHPAVARAVCSALLALAAAYNIKPAAKP
jgi:hypothetical protein